MEEICQFIINENAYTIYDVDRITGKENYVGRSHYEDKTIYIEKRSLQRYVINFKARINARLVI